MAPLEQVITALENAPQIELTDLRSVAQIAGTLKDTVLGAVDIVLSMLFAYSPELEADRERIENEAYDDEAFAAFFEVLKLAYPFGALVRNLKTGPAAQTTKN